VSVPPGTPPPPPNAGPPIPNSDDRRKRPAEGEQDREIKFVGRRMSDERLKALKDFLKTATADDIATIRRMYGDNLEVLRLIGLELTESNSETAGDS